MLEERLNRAEASVRDTSQAGGNSAARAQEAPAANDGRFGFGAFAARYQQENFHGEDTGWRDWFPGVSYLGRTISTRTSARNHQISGGTTWRLGECRAEKCCSRLLSRTDSLLQRESVENCPDQQRRRRI